MVFDYYRLRPSPRMCKTSHWKKPLPNITTQKYMPLQPAYADGCHGLDQLQSPRTAYTPGPFQKHIGERVAKSSGGLHSPKVIMPSTENVAQHTLQLWLKKDPVSGKCSWGCGRKITNKNTIQKGKHRGRICEKKYKTPQNTCLVF